MDFLEVVEKRRKLLINIAYYVVILGFFYLSGLKKQVLSCELITPIACR